MKKYHFGNTEITPLSDGKLLFDRNSFFNDQEDIDWEPYPEYHDKNFYLNLDLQNLYSTLPDLKITR